MTIWHLDLVSGNDANDGRSWATAKRNMVAIAPSPGDGIHIAKTADPTSLSGTLSFTSGSSTVTTSVDLTGTVAVKDMISPDTAVDGEWGWWEVTAITSTTITLVSAFPATLSGGGLKLNTFDVAATQTSTPEAFFRFPIASGTATDRITVSGGWNTATNTRDGYTHIRNTSASRRGILEVRGSYWTITHMGLHRMYTALNLSVTNGASNTIVDTCSFGVADNYHVAFATPDCEVRNTVFAGRNTTTSVRMQTTGHSLKVTDCDFYSCNNAVLASASGNATISGCGIYRCTAALFLTGTNHRVEECSFVSNTTAVQLYKVEGFVMSSCSITLSTTDILVSEALDKIAINNTTLDVAKIVSTIASEIVFDDHQQVAGDHLHISSGMGTSKSTTSGCRSGKCMEIVPSTHATIRDVYYLERRFAIPAKDGIERSISLWMKRNSGLTDYSVRIGLKQFGTWVSDIIPITLTTSYVEQELSFTSDGDGVIELVVQVDATAGSVFIDDITWS